MDIIPSSPQLSLFDGKVCIHCGFWLLFSSYQKHKKTRDGLQSICKSCQLAQWRRWYAKQPKEFRNLADRSYYEINAVRLRQKTHFRRANKRGTYTPEEWEELCRIYDFRCLACGERKPLSVDHVIPISKGGSNEISNLQPLCLSCNCAKNNREIDYRPLFRLKT